MADQRKHRGPHPEDTRLFAADQVPSLQSAVHDLSWLLSHDYVLRSSLKLVGDRYSLTARQRTAVSRSTATKLECERRSAHRISGSALAGQNLWIDGYNVLTSIEAAFANGVILRCQDGTCRDMASMHGSYRKVAETIPAIELIGEHLHSLQVSNVRWLLDQPVSNSGRLKGILQTVAEEKQWNWTVELVPDPDPLLAVAKVCVATADSEILNRAEQWYNLAVEIVREKIPDAWTVDLSSGLLNNEELDVSTPEN